MLQHGIYGEEEKVYAILKNKLPKQLHFLLFDFTETVTDYSGRKIKGNLIRIIMGAEDTDMLKMIRPYCTDACGDDEKAQDEMKRQYDAQFPAENKEAEEKITAADLDELKQFIQAINRASDADCQLLLDNVKDNEKTDRTSVGKARKRFRAYLDAKIEEVITTGKHFNTKLWINAINQYETNHNTFGGRYSVKNKLAWRQVIGYILRYVPACLAQACCQGIYHITNDGEPLFRSLQFRSSPTDSFFPLLPEAGLGYEYARAVDNGHPGEDGSWSGREAVTTYVGKKQRDGELMQHPSDPKPTTNTRTIMK